jgi:hypothetical protein
MASTMLGPYSAIWADTFRSTSWPWPQQHVHIRQKGAFTRQSCTHARMQPTAHIHSSPHKTLTKRRNVAHVRPKAPPYFDVQQEGTQRAAFVLRQGPKRLEQGRQLGAKQLCTLKVAGAFVKHLEHDTRLQSEREKGVGGWEGAVQGRIDTRPGPERVRACLRVCCVFRVPGFAPAVACARGSEHACELRASRTAAVPSEGERERGTAAWYWWYRVTKQR